MDEMFSFIIGILFRDRDQSSIKKKNIYNGDTLFALDLLAHVDTMRPIFSPRKPNPRADDIRFGPPPPCTRRNDNGTKDG